MYALVLVFLGISASAWALDLAPLTRAPVAPPEQILVTKMTSLRSSSFFKLNQDGTELNLLAYLNEGTKGEIIGINTNLNHGVGIQVRISSGPQKGKVGWVYFHKAADRRNMQLMRDGKIVDIEKIYGESTQAEQNPPQNSDRQTPLAVVERYFNQVISQSNGSVLKKSFSNIWKEVAARPDLYSIDLESYDGGELVPINYTYKDGNGLVTNRRFYGRITDQALLSLPIDTQRTLQQRRDRCGATPSPGTETLHWIEGCSVLQGGVGTGDTELLKICLANMRATITKDTTDEQGRVSRILVFENLYRKLNPVEQRFAAMIFTAAGEAGSLTPPNEEMEAIMKVLDNRKKQANQKGAEDANVLDMALQSYQFSFYNQERNAANEPWRRLMLRANLFEHPHIERAINAYISYENGSDFQPTEQADKMTHYYSTILDPPSVMPYDAPDWSKEQEEIKLSVNQQELNGYESKKYKRAIRHKFYSDIAWSYRKNRFRSAVENE